MNGTDRFDTDDDFDGSDPQDVLAKQLLKLAAEGFVPPGDTGADDIMARAGAIRRRRRYAMAASSIAAVLAIGFGAGLLPKLNQAAPQGNSQPQSTTAAAPAPHATGSPAPLVEPGGGEVSASTGPTASPADGPDEERTTQPGGAGISKQTKSSGTPTRSSPPATASTPPAAKDPVAFIAALLPSDTGTLRRQTPAKTPTNPLNGRYFVTKDGKTGYLDVAVVDIAVNRDDWHSTVDDERAHNYCESTGTTPPNTDCTTETLSSGAVFKTWTLPGDQQSGGAAGSAAGFAASLTFANGNQVVLYAVNGLTGPDAPGPAMSKPPLTKSALNDLAKSPAWFRK
ncbi:hypothetical protein [Yinghuangia seranimata]|uniref:hypothetical protein n=1 Tax=Yinghuangia seranimata TaxID=408067 RepID=UPI00248C46A0|nr:hypothetical protein [Yinghuangia seranimata]MDI2128066.1 hypothetical protein [Yinghuangia seranimata]